MGFGGVNVPSPSGPESDRVRKKSYDTNVAAQVLTFGEIQRRHAKDTDRDLAGNLMQFGALHTQQQIDALNREALGEIHEVTLTNSKKFPFSTTADSPVTVALDKVRSNLFYTVDAEIIAHSGTVAEVEISDKALNGFKVAYTGSASSVTLRLRVKGGMT